MVGVSGQAWKKCDTEPRPGLPPAPAVRCPRRAGGRSRPLRFPAEGTERSGAWAVCVHVDRSYAEDRAPKPALSPRTGERRRAQPGTYAQSTASGRGRRFKDWNPPASACTDLSPYTPSAGGDVKLLTVAPSVPLRRPEAVRPARRARLRLPFCLRAARVSARRVAPDRTRGPWRGSFADPDSTRRARSAVPVSSADPLAGPPPGRTRPPPGAFPPLAVRRDRLWVGLEGPEGKVARRSGAERYSPSRHDLAASRGRGRRPLPRLPGARVGGTGPRSFPSPPAFFRDGAPLCPRRDCRPGRTVLSAHPTASRRRAGTGPRPRAPGVCGDVGNPPDPS
ncbi:hypothetical protein AAFF_G00420330 [Aldrovandia affinis]|uniref:Uncharacterized protein n=1 Tax=Aldrovandia affinis TaxID=143900 RepID=A0AAD7R3D2_9TELE|nr:hypothetical protein AAFF_G00420330 [Aldrovandia affinis]